MAPKRVDWSGWKLAQLCVHPFYTYPENFMVGCRSGHGVMTSYITSCSAEIGGFCNLSYLGECHCFLEWVFAFQTTLMVFRDIEKPYTVAPRSKLRKVTPAISRFRSQFRSFFLTLQLSWASGTLFRANLMPDLESTPTNWLYKTRHVSKSSKVISGHLRSLTSNDLECSNFLLRSTTGCCVLAQFSTYLFITIDFRASRR